jgi:hypothetical protein
LPVADMVSFQSVVRNRPDGNSMPQTRIHTQRGCSGSRSGWHGQSPPVHSWHDRNNLATPAGCADLGSIQCWRQSHPIHRAAHKRRGELPPHGWSGLERRIGARPALGLFEWRVELGSLPTTGHEANRSSDRGGQECMESHR